MACVELLHVLFGRVLRSDNILKNIRSAYSGNNSINHYERGWCAVFAQVYIVIIKLFVRILQNCHQKTIIISIRYQNSLQKSEILTYLWLLAKTVNSINDLCFCCVVCAIK